MTDLDALKSIQTARKAIKTQMEDQLVRSTFARMYVRRVSVEEAFEHVLAIEERDVREAALEAHDLSTAEGVHDAMWAAVRERLVRHMRSGNSLEAAKIQIRANGLFKDATADE